MEWKYITTRNVNGTCIGSHTKAIQRNKVPVLKGEFLISPPSLCAHALASIDWSLVDTAPRPRTTTFRDDSIMSDSSSPEASDSAVESSSDD